MNAESILKAMAGGAILHVQYLDGEPVYWLTESNKLASVTIPGMEGKKVATSPLVAPCAPGLLAMSSTMGKMSENELARRIQGASCRRCLAHDGRRTCCFCRAHQSEWRVRFSGQPR